MYCQTIGLLELQLQLQFPMMQLYYRLGMQTFQRFLRMVMNQSVDNHVYRTMASYREPVNSQVSIYGVGLTKPS